MCIISWWITYLEVACFLSSLLFSLKGFFNWCQNSIRMLDTWFLPVEDYTNYFCNQAGFSVNWIKKNKKLRSWKTANKRLGTKRFDRLRNSINLQSSIGQGKNSNEPGHVTSDSNAHQSMSALVLSCIILNIYFYQCFPIHWIRFEKYNGIILFWRVVDKLTSPKSLCFYKFFFNVVLRFLILLTWYFYSSLIINTKTQLLFMQLIWLNQINFQKLQFDFHFNFF